MDAKYMNENEVRGFKNLMLKKGYRSIAMLAREMSISRDALSRKINGKSDWSKAEMELIGKLFEQDPATIFFGK